MLHRTASYILLLAAAGAVLFATARVEALFTVERTIKNNIIRTGKLDITVTPAENLLGSESLLPGQSISNTFSVNNTGTTPVTLALSVKKSAGYKTLYETLRATVTRDNDTLFDGRLVDLQNVALTPQQPLSISQQLDYQVTIHLPLEADSAVDNLYANIAFTINGLQSNG